MKEDSVERYHLVNLEARLKQHVELGDKRTALDGDKKKLAYLKVSNFHASHVPSCFLRFDQSNRSRHHQDQANPLSYNILGRLAESNCLTLRSS